MAGRRRRSRRWGLLAAVFVTLVAVGAVLVAVVGPGRVSPARADRAPAAVQVLPGRPLVAFLGDSWTVGVGATGRHGYALLTAEALHWGYGNFGVGGSGYSVPGPHHSLFAQRIAGVAALHPDVVVVQGSLNERNSTRGALRTAAASTLGELRAALAPGTPVLVLGASYNPGTPAATMDRINAEVAAAAAEAGLPFVNPATADWTDPGDPTVWSDTIHPDDRGHRQVAAHLEPLLQALVREPGVRSGPATVRG